ncbi:MAG: ATP synthase subunit I [Candidatus Aminicenantes bacterium]|nr:ATP synthase subunit I [Candidatus Aminicenantes bacterium]
MNKPANPFLGDEEEKILRRIPVEILIVSLILAIAGLLMYDWITGLLVFAGGILAAVNFLWMKKGLSHILASGKQNAVRSGLGVYALRLLLICAVFFIIIFFFSKRIIAFAAGFSAIIFVFLIEAIVGLSGLKKWKH